MTIQQLAICVLKYLNAQFTPLSASVKHEYIHIYISDIPFLWYVLIDMCTQIGFNYALIS